MGFGENLTVLDYTVNGCTISEKLGIEFDYQYSTNERSRTYMTVIVN